MTNSSPVSGRTTFPDPQHLDRIEITLDTLVRLVEPLHALLKQEQNQEADVIARVQEVMETLGRVVSELDRAATALHQLAPQDGPLSAVETDVAALCARMDALEDQAGRIERKVTCLVNWAGATPRRQEAG